MKKVKLLDCTLRDGGSLNNWMFGEQNTLNIIQNLNDSNIEFIEVGFIDNNREENIDSTNNPSNYFFNELCNKIENKKCETFAMIDFSKYDTKNFNLTKPNGLDGIRIMFKKEQLFEVINFCKKIKELNYKISLNPVSITRYSNIELNILIEETNKLNPEMIYIVDTYGLLNTKETIEYFHFFNNKLNKNINIGYHVHNNLQLALTNSVALINENFERTLIIDASLYGMGKRAGNTPIEAISLYLNESTEKNYQILLITQTINDKILPLKQKCTWGYSLTHYIAAINKCHSDYVTFLRKKANMPINDINKILQRIPDEKKLIFDEKYIIKCTNNYKSAKIKEKGD